MIPELFVWSRTVQENSFLLVYIYYVIFVVHRGIMAKTDILIRRKIR